MTVCVALLGGSFDPVHHGHVALAALFSELLKPSQLRIVPAGSPWQKSGLHANAAQRIAMLELAFRDAKLEVAIDCQEVARGAPTYTIAPINILLIAKAISCLISASLAL